MADYDYYRIFYYVAETGSFTRAAAVLDSSQPNITRCINNLESDLKCRLFERSARGVKLTYAGEKLFAHVRVAVEALEKGTSEILSETGLDSGAVTIGVSENALQLLLNRALSLFHQKYPSVRIRLRSISTPESLHAVEDGVVDFALASSPYPKSSALKIRPLLSFQDCLIAGPAYAALASRTHSIHDLSHETFITLEKESATSQLYEHFFATHNCTLHSGIEVHSGNEVLQLVENNLGLAFYPSAAAEAPIRHGRICRLSMKEHFPERSIVLVQNPSRVLSPAARIFLQSMEKQAS